MIWLTVAAFIFFVAKRRLWLPVAGKHEAFMALHHRYFGDHFPNYFQIFLYPLHYYIWAMVYGRSKPLGNLVYDLFLTIPGFLLYTAVMTIFGSPTAALLSACAYYAYAILPSTYGVYLEPEGIAAAFAIAGLACTALALQAESTPAIILGASLAALACWIKVSSLISVTLWTPALVYWTRGLGQELLLCAGTIFLMTVLFGILAAVPRPGLHPYCYNFGHDALGEPFLQRFRFFVEFQRFVLNNKRYGRVLTGFLREIGQVLWHNVLLTSPLLALFAAFLLHGDPGTDVEWLLFAWLAIAMLQCLLRSELELRYAFMAIIPLAVGSGLYLEQFVATSDMGSLGIVLGSFCVAAALFALSHRLSSWPAASEELLTVKKEIIDPLRGRLSPQDTIFVNGFDPEIYYELGCGFPPLCFHWAGYYTKFFFGRRRERRQAYLAFFLEKKPTFFIDCIGDIRFDYLEEVSGLRYELDFTTSRATVYRLVSVKDNAGQINFDMVRMYHYI